MALYGVHVFCDACSRTYPMGIRVALDDGPVDRASIGDTYAGRALPETVATLLNDAIRCPETGTLVRQRNNNQVFLVAVDQ